MNMVDLRETLADEIKKLRSGKTTPENVNAVATASGKILHSIKIEMEYNKLLGKKPSIAFIATK